MMPIVVLAVMVGGVLLALFLNRDRRQADGCCCPSDPRRDARMRGAFIDVDGVNPK